MTVLKLSSGCRGDFIDKTRLILTAVRMPGVGAEQPAGPVQKSAREGSVGDSQSNGEQAHDMSLGEAKQPPDWLKWKSREP